MKAPEEVHAMTTETTETIDTTRRPSAKCPDCDPGPVIKIKPGQKPTPIRKTQNDCEYCDGFGVVEARANGDCDLATCSWCQGSGRRRVAA